MKNMSFILVLAFMSIAASCCDNDEGEKTTIDLNFKATFGSDPLVLYQEFAAPNGHNFEMRVFNFFISEITLIDQNDEEVQIAESAYVNFNSVTDQTAAEAGVTLRFTEVPVGSYKSIRFGVGVSPSLNAMDPADFSTANALGNTGNYWTSWGSYIFSRTEGEIDSLPTASGGAVQFLYHSGVDGMYQSRSFSKTIDLAANQENLLNFSLDSREIFYKTGAEIDIPTNNVSHSGDPQTAAFQLSKDILTNIADAISIR